MKANLKNNKIFWTKEGEKKDRNTSCFLFFYYLLFF